MLVFLGVYSIIDNYHSERNVSIDSKEWSQFRYRKFMALDGEEWRNVSLGEGMTPIIRLDEDVMLKIDYFMPTLSFKDRGAAESGKRYRKK